MKRVLLFILFITVFTVFQAADNAVQPESCWAKCWGWLQVQSRVQQLPAGAAAAVIPPANAGAGAPVPVAVPMQAAVAVPVAGVPGQVAQPAINQGAGYARASEVPLPVAAQNLIAHRVAQARTEQLRSDFQRVLQLQSAIVDSQAEIQRLLIARQEAEQRKQQQSPSMMRDSARKRQFQASAGAGAGSPRLIRPTAPGKNTPVAGNSPASVRERAATPVVYSAAAAGAGSSDASPQIGGRSLVDTMQNNPHLVISGNKEVNLTIHNFVPAGEHVYPASLEHMVELAMDDEENQERNQREFERLTHAAATVHAQRANAGAGPGPAAAMPMQAATVAAVLPVVSSGDLRHAEAVSATIAIPVDILNVHDESLASHRRASENALMDIMHQRNSSESVFAGAGSQSPRRPAKKAKERNVVVQGA